MPNRGRAWWPGPAGAPYSEARLDYAYTEERGIIDIRALSPYAFILGPIDVRWYGVFMAVSMLVGLWYLGREGPRQLGVDADFLYNWGMIAIVGGVVGARLMFVITNPVFFLHHPTEIPMVQLGGLSIHGGLLGGVLAAWWYARRRQVPLQALADLSLPGIGLGIILVRFGNIFNHEILGYHAGILGGARHPAQLYGAAIGAVLLLVYARQSRARPRPPDGYRWWSAIFYYSILRFVNEFFREQNPHYLIQFTVPYLGIGGITLTQWVTPGVIALALVARRRALRQDARWRVEPAPPPAVGDLPGPGSNPLRPRPPV